MFFKRRETQEKEMVEILRSILSAEIAIVSFEYNTKFFGNILVELSTPTGKHKFVIDRGDIYHNGIMLCNSSYLYLEKESSFSKLLKLIKSELNL